VCMCVCLFCLRTSTYACVDSSPSIAFSRYSPLASGAGILLCVSPLLSYDSPSFDNKQRTRQTNKNRTAARIFTTTPSQCWQLRVCGTKHAASPSSCDGAMPPPAQPQPSHAHARARAPFPAVAGRGRVGRCAVGPRAWDACEGTSVATTTTATAGGLGCLFWGMNVAGPMRGYCGIVLEVVMDPWWYAGCKPAIPRACEVVVSARSWLRRFRISLLGLIRGKGVRGGRAEVARSISRCVVCALCLVCIHRGDNWHMLNG
jgi:hypothetical protein